MRLTFLTLIVVIFVVTCVGFTSAERRTRDVTKIISSGGDNVAKLTRISNTADDVLKASDEEVAKILALVKKSNAGGGGGLNDEELGKFAITLAAAQKKTKLTDDQVFKLSKMVADAKKTDEVLKVSDEEVAKMSIMLKDANARALGWNKLTNDELAFAAAQKGAGLSDDQVGKLVRLFANAEQASTSSDESVVKLSQELAAVAQKDKKSWSTLQKVIVGTLGISIGGAVIYGAVKWANKDSSSATTTTSTTSGSA